MLRIGAPSLGQVGWGAVDRGAEGFDHRAAVWLAVVRRANHEDLTLKVKEAAGEGQRRAPLASAGFSRQLLDPGFGVGESLRDGRVWLVRAGRRHALVLEVDVGRCVERLLKAAGTVERRWAPELVDLAHLLRDVDLRLLRDLLHDQLFGEDAKEIFRPCGLLSGWVQRRQRFTGQVGSDVDPVGRDLVFCEQVLRCVVGHRSSSPPRQLGTGEEHYIRASIRAILRARP